MYKVKSHLAVEGLLIDLKPQSLIYIHPFESRIALYHGCQCVSPKCKREGRKEMEAAYSNFQKIDQIECGLEMHPDKSKLVYCSDDKRQGSYPNNQFTFLGYSFRPRPAKSHKGTGVFVGFQPVVSPDAMKAMREKIRAYKIHRRTDLSLEQIAFDWDRVIRGWWNYYGKFYRS